MRIVPGRLSVSRAFGDIEAKREKFGGNPNVVVAIPEIKEFIIDAISRLFFPGISGNITKLRQNSLMDI